MKTFLYIPRYAGVNPHSQEAYQLACQGIIRPLSTETPPILYGVKCIYFNPPDFTLGKYLLQISFMFKAKWCVYWLLKRQETISTLFLSWTSFIFYHQSFYFFMSAWLVSGLYQYQLNISPTPRRQNKQNLMVEFFFDVCFYM